MTVPGVPVERFRLDRPETMHGFARAGHHRGVGTILIADDESASRRLVCAILEAEGYRVLEATNGLEAVAVAAAMAPDAILLDVHMAFAGGVEACCTLKALAATAAIPVLLLTAHDDDAARELAARAGANAFVTKPVGRATLASHVRKTIIARRR